MIIHNNFPHSIRGAKCGDLVLDEEKGEDCQLWQFDGDLDSSTRIINKEGDALDVENWHSGGRNLIARAPVNALNQKFKLVYARAGFGGGGSVVGGRKREIVGGKAL